MSIIEFNFNKKSEYFTDPKIKKWRIISNILFIIGFPFLLKNKSLKGIQRKRKTATKAYGVNVFAKPSK